jgi:hypothetical protein
LDDCWAVATIWAAASSKPTIVYPTMTTFRRYAENPDKPGATGGDIWDCNRGADGCWPTLPNYLVVSSDFNDIETRINQGQPGSIALDSAALPADLRFNFWGKHQIGVHRPNTSRPIYAMNPLAPANTTPGTISWDELKTAMRRLIPGTPLPYRALFFPKPSSGPLWGWDVDADIQAAYSASSVASKLRALGITTYGSRINETDLEAGCKARRIDYGTSIQLIDVRALMKPGTGPV